MSMWNDCPEPDLDPPEDYEEEEDDDYCKEPDDEPDYDEAAADAYFKVYRKNY